MSEGIVYQNKDILFKILGQTYKEKSFAAYGIDLPPIRELLPTDLPKIAANEKSENGSKVQMKMMYDFFSFVHLFPERIMSESILHWKYLAFLRSSSSLQHSTSTEYMVSCSSWMQASKRMSPLSGAMSVVFRVIGKSTFLMGTFNIFSSTLRHISVSLITFPNKKLSARFSS